MRAQNTADMIEDRYGIHEDDIIHELSEENESFLRNSQMKSSRMSDITPGKILNQEVSPRQHNSLPSPRGNRQTSQILSAQEEIIPEMPERESATDENLDSAPSLRQVTQESQSKLARVHEEEIFVIQGSRLDVAEEQKSAKKTSAVVATSSERSSYKEEADDQPTGSQEPVPINYTPVAQAVDFEGMKISFANTFETFRADIFSLKDHFAILSKAVDNAAYKDYIKLTNELFVGCQHKIS